MRQRFSAQSEFGLVPIEQIVLPLKSRDELPPILAGLQWIWTQPTLKAEIFALLEAKTAADRPGDGGPEDRTASGQASGRRRDCLGALPHGKSYP